MKKRSKKKPYSLSELFYWAFFTGGNLGVSIGRLSQFVATDELSKLIGCIMHLAIGLWLLIWCNPTKRGY